MEHSHFIHKTVRAPHVDNFGVTFGAAEHKKIADKLDWDDNVTDVQEVTHTHANVTVNTHPTTGLDLLSFKKSADSAEAMDSTMEAGNVAASVSAAVASPDIQFPEGVKTEGTKPA